jgi:serine/threonine protein kinase
MIDTITVLNDRYEIRDRLTRKAGRSTFLAFDRQTETLVILKEFRFGQDSQWSGYKLLEREATTLKNIDHKAIPKYCNYLEVADGVILIQSFIDAPTLETLIQEGKRFSEGELIDLAEQILSILTYLHGLSPPVIHRDLKPSNILLSDRSGDSIGRISIVDFGAVQMLQTPENDTIVITGTFGYIAPEAFTDQTITAASDLFSLGRTLVYLISGVPPGDLESVRQKVVFDRSHLTTKFSRWLDRMLEPSLDRRFSSAKLAHAALISDSNEENFSGDQSVNNLIQLSSNSNRLQLRFPGVIKIRNSWADWPFWTLMIFSYLFFGFICPLITHPAILITILLMSPLLFVGLSSRSSSERGAKYLESTVVSIERAEKQMNIGVHSSETNEIVWKDKAYYQPIDTIVYYPPFNIDTRTGFATTDPMITIHAGDFEYVVSHRISAVELEKLGHYVADFIDMKLHVIDPILAKEQADRNHGNYCGGCGCC